MSKPLHLITTHWTEIEALQQKPDLKHLADYLGNRYFEAVKNISNSPEIASDVFYELLKNNYSGLKRLTREKGSFRGYLRKIYDRQLYKQHQSNTKTKENQEILQENRILDSSAENKWIDICLDLKEALDNLQKKYPELYSPLYKCYFEDKSIAIICRDLSIKENKVRKRIKNALEILENYLNDYQDNRD